MSALDFESSSSQYGDSASASGVAGDIATTWMAWINPESVGTAVYVPFAWGDAGVENGAYAVVIGIVASGDFGVNTGGAHHAYSNTGIVSTGSWQHIAITKPTGAIAGTLLYLNGVSQTVNVTGNATPTYEDELFKLASNYNHTSASRVNYYDGKVALVKVWDRELSANEIAVEYRSFYPKFFTNLKAFYPVWENTSTTVKDPTQTSAGGTITVVNTPTWVDGPPVTTM